MTDDEELRHALDALSDRLRETVTREVQQMTAQVVARPASPPIDAGSTARVLDAMRAIDEARSLTAILDALRTSVARDSSRVMLWLVRGPRLTSVGGPLEQKDLEGSGPIADAVRTRAAAGNHARPEAPTASLAVPVLLAGEPVAVVYAEQDDAASASWPAAIEAITRHASRALEAMTAFKAVRSLKSQV